MPSDLRENVRNVGFVQYGKPKTLSAKVFERRADKIKLLAVDDQETVVERQTGLDHKTAVLGIELIDIALRKLVAAHAGNEDVAPPMWRQIAGNEDVAPPVFGRQKAVFRS